MTTVSADDNRPGAKISQGVIENWWRQGMMGGAKAHYDCIKVFSETDHTEDLKKITVPVLVMHSEDDQIVPFADAGPLSAKLLKNSTLNECTNASFIHCFLEPLQPLYRGVKPVWCDAVRGEFDRSVDIDKDQPLVAGWLCQSVVQVMDQPCERLCVRTAICVCTPQHVADGPHFRFDPISRSSLAGDRRELAMFRVAVCLVLKR
jgi:hypothetical protein